MRAQARSTSEIEEPVTAGSFSTSEVLDSLEQYDDVVSWINEVLDSGETGNEADDSATSLVDLDRRVTNLVGVLEVASEDTSSQVERLIDTISRGATRLTYDLHFMREGALTLQALLHDVETKTENSVEKETSAALDQLHLLDRAKTNMIAAREVLREAESWSTLESDVTSLLGEQNYEKAAERLSEANKSMIVFQNTPEYENRRTLMVSLQNQLEASLSSALVAAVNSQDVAVCRNYFSIFCNIQRESEFRNYYYGSRRAPLTESWQTIQLADCDNGSPGGTNSSTFAHFLSTFYPSFVSVLQTERTSIPSIFPDPQPTLATLITSTLSALQPTFSQRLSSLSAHYNSLALPELIKVYKTTEEFAVSAEKILEKIGYSTVLSPNPSGERPAKHNRRRSTRMSISGRINLPTSGANATLGVGALAALEWDQDLFEPFIDLQIDYSSLERKFLTNALQDIMDGDVQPSTDHSRLLRERSVDMFSIAEEAMARCIAFTHGYGFAGLIKCLDELFVRFAEQSKAEIATRRTSQQSVAGGASASGDLSDLDYTSEDWSDIQSLLHLLEAVRTFKERMGSFEGKLRSGLLQTSSFIQAARQNPVGFDISGTTRGAIHLLAQSTLNSVELQTLLGQVDPALQAQKNDPNFLSPTPPTPGRSPHVSMIPLPVHHPPILVEAYEAVSQFAKACQIALQDTILRPLRKRLATYPNMTLWSQADPKAKRAGGGGGSALSEVHVPTFSLSPTETIQRVAEGLLNLPRLFEVYAEDDGLSFSLDTLPFVTSELLKSLAEPPVPTSAVPPTPHSRRSPSLSFKMPPVASQAPETEQEFTPEAVSSIWLSSLSLSLLSHLTFDVLPSIRTLSSGGASQLASDLGYLSSIVMALNVESEELERWKECVEWEDGDGKDKAKEVKESNGKVDGVLGTVSKLRGWNI
ncbi:hypothetical protein QCA50_013707 [Cerrena zonata]|uniref:Conserved oligomeric Golgi complex subunit 7 n=1 Tax=Cerrena zonata TaxID=2478898 RepID=A0AAW0G1W3_9APHY